MITQADTPYSNELNWPSELIPFEAQSFDIQANPFPHYAWMRENAPALRTRVGDADVWFLSRFADVQAALRAPKIFSSAVMVPQPLVFLTLFDPPEQTRLRQVVAASFTPKAVGRLEEQIRHFADEYLDELIQTNGGDAVEDFALKLTMATISSLLGIPPSDFEQMKLWSDDVSSYFGRLTRQAPGLATDEQGTQDFFTYMKKNLEHAATDPQSEESVSGHLARLWKQGVLSEREAIHFCGFLFVAGHETTTVLIANAFLTLIAQPSLLQRLRANPQETPRFIEELARHRGTLQRLSRITVQDVEVAGQLIPANTFVKLLPGSANRDESRFQNAAIFNMDRDTTGHLGFGHGIHSCLGAHLARLEGRIAVELIAKRLRSIEITDRAAIRYVTGGNMANGGPSSLPVKVQPY